MSLARLRLGTKVISAYGVTIALLVVLLGGTVVTLRALSGTAEQFVT